MSKVNLFAWASIGENGRATGGKAGDQTGREVKVGNYYWFSQNEVIRFKKGYYGRRAAKIAKWLANNNATGYNQSSRQTLFDLAEKCNWKFSTLKQSLKTTKVNTDCSAFASTVINLAFKKRVIGCATTSTITDACKRSGLFKVISVKEAETKWHKGDMPNKPGRHIIINV